MRFRKQRARALLFSYGTGDEKSISALVQCLDDKFKYVRRTAAWTLGMLKWKPQSEEERSSYLKAEKERDEILRQDKTLEAVIDRYSLDLRADDAGVQRKAAKNLGDINVNLIKNIKMTPEVHKILEGMIARRLIDALEQKDVKVRREAVNTLVKHPSSIAVESLIQTLTDNDKHTRQAAAIALGNIGDPRALDALTKAKEDKSWFVCHEAKTAIKKIMKKHQNKS